MICSKGDNFNLFMKGGLTANNSRTRFAYQVKPNITLPIILLYIYKPLFILSLLYAASILIISILQIQFF